MERLRVRTGYGAEDARPGMERGDGAKEAASRWLEDARMTWFPSGVQADWVSSASSVRCTPFGQRQRTQNCEPGGGDLLGR